MLLEDMTKIEQKKNGM